MFSYTFSLIKADLYVPQHMLFLISLIFYSLKKTEEKQKGW